MSRVFEALQRANPELNRPLDRCDESPEGLSQFAAAITGELAALEDAPLFAIPETPEARLIAWTDPNSMASEKLRGLASKLRHAQQRKSVKKLLVTSAIRGDGKSAISANLAITLATHGEKTLLIDGDLHKPTLAKTLGVDGEQGFATWHENSGKITDLLYRAQGAPLWFLPAGICQEQPLTLIQSEKTAELLKELSGWFSWVVIDSPPLVPLADSSIWATMSDAVLLLARQGLTPKSAFLKSVAAIDRSKLFGVIMNDANATEERYYQAYYSGKMTANRASKARS